MLQRVIGKGWRYRSMSLDNLQGHVYRVNRATRANALWPKWLGLWRTTVEDRESLEQMIARLNELKPDRLGGFGSTISDLFTRLDATGEPFHRPRLVRYASEALPESVRQLLTAKYGIEVFSAYQSVEGLKMAWECDAHQGYHINADHYPIRIVGPNGQDVADGETGEIVMSNLVNRGTVLLNYRTGDLAARIDAPCTCGRGLPRIGWIEGRATDVQMSTDGRRVAPGAVSGVIWSLGGAWQWQLVQQAPDHLLVRLCLAPNADLERLTAGIAERAHTELGADMRVTVVTMDEIPRTPAGKLRQVVNLVTHPEHSAGVG
jgi:phenylacetate-CoA ligase